MRTIERRIEVAGRSDIIQIVPMFDLHVGTKRCREDKLKAAVEEIRQTDNCYWVYGGDGAELIQRSDPRHKESELATWLHGEDDIAKAQIDYLIKLLTPIAHKCIGVLSGNHEGQILRHYERNVYANILESIKDAGGIKEQIGIGYRGFIVLRIERGGEKKHHTTTLNIYAEHGWGGGRLKGGDILNGQRVFSTFDCDVYMCGHRHKAYIMPHTVETPRGSVTKFAAQTGTFRDAGVKHDETDAGGYEDMKGYPPADVAGVRIRFEPDAFKLSGEIYPY